MSSHPTPYEPTSAANLAFSTRCLPGSAAEQEEKERLAEFHRQKALRLEEEARDKPESDARRARDYQISSDANRERMRRDKAARAIRPGFLRT